MKRILFLLNALLIGVQLAANGAAPMPQIYEVANYTLVFDEEFTESPNFYSTINPWGPIGGSKVWISHTPNGRDFSADGYFGNDNWNFEDMGPLPTGGYGPVDSRNGVLNAFFKSWDRWHASMICSMDGNRNGFATKAPFYAEACILVPPLLSNDIPNASGLWSSFWMSGVNGLSGGNGNVPEIDVFEAYSNDYIHYHFNCHDWFNNGGSDILANGTTVNPGVNITQGFHVYSVWVNTDYIRGYFDGYKVAEVPTTPDMLQPMYLMADIALGGGWPIQLNQLNNWGTLSTNGGPEGGVYQMKMLYIRCWELNP